MLLVMAVAVVAGCSSIDCPLNNTVYTKYKLAGNVTTLNDTLTISVKRTEGSDTVLLNKALGVDSFSIPLSYSHDTDEFYFDIHPTDGDRTRHRNHKQKQRASFRIGRLPGHHVSHPTTSNQYSQPYRFGSDKNK